MTNPAMPGLVKVGFTTGTPEERARQLDSTGVPASFVVDYALFVENPSHVEDCAHVKLEKWRVSRGREFFRCSVEVAKEVLLDLCQGKIKQEMAKDGSIISSVIVLRSGDVISCSACGGLVRPFNSVLTDREKGTTRCASCGHEIRFRVETPRSSLVPVSVPRQSEATLTAKIRGDYFRGAHVTFECPSCGRYTTLPPSHMMRCPHCGRSSGPGV
jgi:DNA-directed RNA polymerase subunit RPC12/RpoP